MKRQYINKNKNMLLTMVVVSACCTCGSLQAESIIDWLSSTFSSLKDFAQSIYTSVEIKNVSLTKKEVITKEVPLSELGRITVLNKAGFIKITGWDKKIISAEITKLAATDADLKKIAIGMEFAEDKASFTTTYDERSLRAEVQYVLKVPRTAVLAKVAVGAGAIDIEGITGGVTAQTGSGALTVTDSKGPLTASTGSGDVTVAVEIGNTDPLDIKTGSGSITINQSGGPVAASTGAGSIDLNQKSMAADTSIALHTGTGSINLTLPATASATIEGKMGLGDFTSDFSEVTESKKRITGILGKGDAVIKLTTGTGSISLKKG